MSEKKPGWQIPDSDSSAEEAAKKRAKVWSNKSNVKPERETFTEFDEARGRINHPQAKQKSPKKTRPSGIKRLMIYFSVLIALYVGLKIYNPSVSIFDTPYGLRSFLILVVFGGAFAYFSRSSTSRIVKAVFSWVAIITVISGVYVVTKGQEYSLSNITPSRIVINDSEMHVTRAVDGHFWVMTQINGQNMPMMVDTGASMVVLSQKDARQVGIIMGDLRFTGSSSTANGTVSYAQTRIDDFRIGNVTFTNFTVTVNGGKMRGSLLGLDALNEFSSYEISGDTMILRP